MKNLDEIKIIINFDTKFFSKENVLLAAHEYTNLCWMLVDGSDKSISVIMIPKEKAFDSEKLKDEFYNYVLATTKNAQFN